MVNIKVQEANLERLKDQIITKSSQYTDNYKKDRQFTIP